MQEDIQQQRLKEQATAEKDGTKCGFVAVIGAPNAGKSTLINRMVGTKVSIVSHKVQTTRSRVLGVAMQDKTQLVLIDTPGIFNPSHRLERAMVDSAWSGVKDADSILLMVDSNKGLTENLGRIIHNISGKKVTKYLALNKVDLINKEKLFALTEQLNELCQFDHTFMISALNGVNVDRLVDQLCQDQAYSPWLFPAEYISDLPEKNLAAEITREKIFNHVHKELPYSITVETESWEEQKNGIKINQTIYVTRNSHKKIIIGHQGSKLKTIGQLARTELSELLEVPVHLFLFVKVRENWQNDPERYNYLGLNFKA